MKWMRSLSRGRWCFVLMWYGWSGWTARYRWGILGNKWPTVYAGPIKLCTGPA